VTVAETRFKAYGEDYTSSGTQPTTFRFTGQRLDSGIQLYFYNARYYDHIVGRFVQADTIVPQAGNPQSLNRYAYTLNNPLRYVDPTGHRACADTCDVRRSNTESAGDAPAGSNTGTVGPVVTKYSAVIVMVELRRGIPPGYLGAIVRHESTNNHKFLDDFLARHVGLDRSIGVAEVKVSTAQLVEGAGYHIPPSPDRATLINRLSDPVQNIDYAGAYLEYMHDWVKGQVPADTSDEWTWELAVVGYNLGPDLLRHSLEQNGLYRLGREGSTYYQHTVPYVSQVASFMYRD
jgi:RHS repeat-associated protein